MSFPFVLTFLQSYVCIEGFSGSHVVLGTDIFSCTALDQGNSSVVVSFPPILLMSFDLHEQSNDGNQKLFFASVCPVHAGAGEATPAAGFKFGAEADPQGK